jgi:hypothetical protein
MDADGGAAFIEWGIAFGADLNPDSVLLTYDSRVAAEADLELSGATFLVRRPVTVGPWEVVEQEQEADSR